MVVTINSNTSSSNSYSKNMNTEQTSKNITYKK